MGGDSLLRIGLTHKDFLVSLTMLVWVACIVWRSEPTVRGHPERVREAVGQCLLCVW